MANLRRLTERERSAVQTELEAHMEDHMLALIELGYDEALAEELLALGFLTRSEDGTLQPARELNLDELLVNGISLVQGPCIEPET